MKNKLSILLAGLLMAILGVTGSATAIGTGTPSVPQPPKPFPAAIGRHYPAVNPGERQVYLDGVRQADNASVTALLARGTKEKPVEIVVATADFGMAPGASGLRGTMVTRTASFYKGFSLLWSSFRQTWGYHDGIVYYWPNGLVDCYANGPTYHASCRTTPYQEYGLYWNQGHTLWDATLCGAYVNYLFNATCLSTDRIYRWYTFNADGSYWRFA